MHYLVGKKGDAERIHQHIFLKTAKCITLHVHSYESARSVLKIGELCGSEVEEEREDADWTISKRDAMAGKMHIKWFQGPNDIRDTTQIGYVLCELRINWKKYWQVLLDDGTRHICAPATWSNYREEYDCRYAQSLTEDRGRNAPRFYLEEYDPVRIQFCTSGKLRIICNTFCYETEKYSNDINNYRYEGGHTVSIKPHYPYMDNNNN